VFFDLSYSDDDEEEGDEDEEEDRSNSDKDKDKAAEDSDGDGDDDENENSDIKADPTKPAVDKNKLRTSGNAELSRLRERDLKVPVQALEGVFDQIFCIQR
jgi:hypothetical protein